MAWWSMHAPVYRGLNQPENLKRIMDVQITHAPVAFPPRAVCIMHEDPSSHELVTLRCVMLRTGYDGTKAGQRFIFSSCRFPVDAGDNRCALTNKTRRAVRSNDLCMLRQLLRLSRPPTLISHNFKYNRPAPLDKR